MGKIAVIGIVGNSVFLPVERFHTGGETVEASSVHFEPGGKGFNQAVAAARDGADVSFFGAVGTEGRESVEAFLDKEGIDGCLIRKPGQTAFAAIVTDAQGETHVTVYQGAALSLEDVDAFRAKIEAADILLLNNEVPEEINLRAARVARAAGVKIILNPAPARPLPPALADSVFLFTPNEFEAEGLAGRDNVLVTLGGAGCRLPSGEILPAFRAGPVLDTTGAGDTFSGVLASALSDGGSLAEAAKRAVTAAGLGVTRRYAVSSIPRRGETDRALGRTPEKRMTIRQGG